MTPELESAARAIDPAAFDEVIDPMFFGLLHRKKERQEDARKAARAAFAAVLLEPSEGMCNAVAPWLHRTFATGAIQDLGRHILGESE